MTHQREALIKNIEVSLQDMSRLLKTGVDNQDWRPEPEAWSFREVAAHMATVEQECHQDRVTRISAGEQPHYDYYLNSDRDFSHLALMDSLQDWADTRQAIINTVRDLSEAQLALTGTHTTFGTVTVLDILAEMHNHDQAHIQELRQIIEDVHQE